MNYDSLDFVIVGPGHTGSTWLGTQLRSTDEIFVTKETNWLTWSNKHSHMPLSAFFSGANTRKILGEHGNTYFSFPRMPEILRSANPKIKIIIIFRDPLERAVSHFFHDRRYGTIPRRLGVDVVLFRDFFHHRYIGESLYGKNLAAYLAHFDANQIYVFASPRDNKNTIEQFSELQRFLGSTTVTKARGKLQYINHRRTPLFPNIHWKATFGEPGLARNLSSFLDYANCALGKYLISAEISDEERKIFSDELPASDLNMFFDLCAKHGVRGVEFVAHK